MEGGIEALVDGANSVKLTIQDKQKWPAAIYLGELDALTATDSE
ncbi:hypothetical protein [Flavobacterium sp. 3HN19-14]